MGSLLRTADGLGVEEVYLTGYTPYPVQPQDDRLPHLSNKIDRQIAKTSLGAEETLGQHVDSLEELLETLRKDDFVIAGLEQTSDAVDLPNYKVTDNMAIIVGREVEGIESEVLKMCDIVLEIPMKGRKESFNVAAAAAITLYHLSLIGPNL